MVGFIVAVVEIEFEEQMLIRNSEGIPTGERCAQLRNRGMMHLQGLCAPAVVWEDVARISIECDAP